MIDEQVKDVSTTAIPADEGSNDGSDATQSEQTEQTPVEQAFDPKAAYAALEEKLTNMGREMGQSRGMQSKFDKLVAALEGRSQLEKPNNQTQNDFLGKYTPDQIAESEALIEHLWKKKFGAEWDSTQSQLKEQQYEKVANTFESAARGYAGKDYETLDPLMTKISAAAYEASKNGDEEAREFVSVMTQFPKVGARQLVTLAREWHADQTKEKSGQAVANLQQRGASVAAKTPGGSQRQSQTADPNTMSIDELRKRVEAGE